MYAVHELIGREYTPVLEIQELTNSCQEHGYKHRLKRKKELYSKAKTRQTIDFHQCD